MNRKLHNTVTALFATSGLLALSLMAANPLPPSATVPGAAQFAHQAAAGAEARAQSPDRLPAGAGSQLAGLEAEAVALAAVAKAFKAEAKGEAAGARKAARSQRGRQSVAMPFFSFFPKG